MPEYNRTLDFVMTQSDGTAFVVSATAYTADDVVGGLGRVKTGSGGGMLLRGVSIRDTHKQSEPYIIHIYRSEPSTIADADPFAPTVADADLEIGTVTINNADYATDAGSSYSKAYKAIDKIEVRESSGGTLYVYLQCTATPDYNAVTDVKVEFWYWMD